MAIDSTKSSVTLDQPRKAQGHQLQSRKVSPVGATGPRTPRGKQKSRYNALKHGIFAQVVLRGSALKESKADYLNLLQSFREGFQPAGGAEEFLVEKLAMLAWRKARAVRAEAAIIMKQTEFLRADRETRLKRASEGDQIESAILGGGIARRSKNPYLMAKAVKMLEALEGAIQERGFDSQVDEGLLRGLYGDQGYRDGVFSLYRFFSDEVKKAPDDPARKIEQQAFLKALRTEIRRLEGEMVDLAAREERELPLVEESLAIPGEEELDRLLRYETRLDGSFERTLQQLERLQRLRLGQPVPPTVKVDVTH